MRKLNIERLKEQMGCDEQGLAERFGISLCELKEYGSGSKKLESELFEKIINDSGLMPKFLFIDDTATMYQPTTDINPADTFKTSQLAKDGLVNYIRQGLTSFQEETVRTEIKKIQYCMNTLRKPRISFAGQSDAGKSTLINALLNTDKMPAKWTPTTSIVVHIKHIDDRPSFIQEDVWILGKHSGELWDDSRLDDEVYCREFLLAKGDFSLLETFGTHQGQSKALETASSAVAFIDSPILKDCDILDLPGLGACAEDDALHHFNTKDNETDILIYLSRANGFLSDMDSDYLHTCIRSLRAIENKKNNLDKLCNLFVIASQAGSANSGNVSELKYTINNRCNAFCNTCAKDLENNSCNTLLPFRSKKTGYEYSEDDFRKRFFTYEKNQPRLCEEFISAFTATIENIPRAIYQDFISGIKTLVGHSNVLIQNRIDEWQNMLKNKSQYMELVREIKQKEPARIVERKEKHAKMLSQISSCAITSTQKIQTIYDSTINIDNLIELMEENNIKNKKDDKQDFVTLVNELIKSKIQKVISDQTDHYSEILSQYLNEYSSSFQKYSISKSVNVQFDAVNSFALGLTGIGALGASAAWLATSMTAWSVAALGTYAGWGAVLAVGGVVGIAVCAIAATLIAVFKALTWKKDLATEITKAYKKANYIDTIFANVDEYWADTQTSFNTASEQVEKDWQKRIAEYEEIADEKNIPILESKIAEAKRGLDFFTKLPLPEIG